MTADIVNDLELDQDNHSYFGAADEVPPERLEKIRAYLGSYYLVSKCVCVPIELNRSLARLLTNRH